VLTLECHNDTILILSLGLFTHTHLVGAGITDFGNFGVMPVVWKDLDKNFLNEYSYKSYFNHDKETVEAGYYKVHLERYKVDVELTTTDYVGVHRYTFPADKMNDAKILFEVSNGLHPDSCKDSEVTIDYESQEISGWTLNSGSLTANAGGIQMYFAAKLDSSFKSYGVYNFNTSSVINPGKTNTRGTHIGAYVEQLGSNTVTLYVGVSFISVDQARKNLVSDLAKLSQSKLPTFDAVRQDSQNVWRDQLNRIKVTTDNTVDKVKFYTAFYHTMCSPTIYTESGNTYLGFDKKVHTGDDFNFVSDLSLWDIHRTQVPFLSLMFGKTPFKNGSSMARDVVKSLVAMFQQGGSLPKWPIASGDGSCMIGTHAIIAIVDGFMKIANLTQQDRDAAREAMVFAATKPMKTSSRSDLDFYLQHGYVAYDHSWKGACQTVEYAYDDWALGMFINETYSDRQQEAKVFIDRGKNYKNVFDTKYNFFVPRNSDGTWKYPDSWIDFINSEYVEGDAWHYRFFAPHDIPGLVSLFNSTEYFFNQLDELFSRSKWDPLNIFPNPYYWAGNEHNLFSVWAFNWVQRQDKTQEYSRYIMQHKYTDKPDGIPGNDDYGTMSAWYIFSSIGFYPLSASRLYTLGSPIFQRVEMQLYDGCTLIIQAQNSCSSCEYVKSVTVNGSKLSQPFIYHDKHLTCSSTMSQIIISFEMDSKPHYQYSV
jgi:predicted alpha-1,2-mannosidase